ncbi:uncharacterized protein LOC121726008 [Aricia agestis]|uniref:uncharacterized protein LOC121726008 n=1 Tax=Aricia agestis TaxID=91739 RepID=UPI001C20B936|nr:uncharacterized protein LOC121726008 [Aricia agestis]
MKQFIVLLSIIAVSAAAWEPGLRIKFNVGLRPGTDFFFDVPKTVDAAISEGWSLTQRINTAPYPSLVLYCPADRDLCAYFDDLGYIAGLQIALAQDEFTDAIFDWETQGFTEWVPATPTGEIKKYWTIQQYFVSEAYLLQSAADREAMRKEGVLLQEDAVWVTGINRAIDRISTSRTDIENSVYTRQACLPWMGRHFYYNMSAETTCTASTMYPWFPLVHSGQLIATGFVVFGKLPIIEGQRDWFERPPRLAVQVIVPRGPQCLYDLVDSVGLLTMHIYYVENPWTIGCLLQ